MFLVAAGSVDGVARGLSLNEGLCLVDLSCLLRFEAAADGRDDECNHDNWDADVEHEHNGAHLVTCSTDSLGGASHSSVDFATLRSFGAHVEAS